MTADIPDHKLQAKTARIVRRAAAGERFRITVDGRPVAELGPLGSAQFAPYGDVVTGLSGLLAPTDNLADELKSYRLQSR